jgi:hypothetical protein
MTLFDALKLPLPKRCVFSVRSGAFLKLVILVGRKGVVAELLKITGEVANKYPKS